MSRNLRILKELKQCVEDADEILSESDDSGGEEILEGLLSVCQEALKLGRIKPGRPVPAVEEKKRVWVSAKRQAVDRAKALSYIHQELAKKGFDEWKFKSILSYIESDLEGKSTSMRTPIPPADKLALTLRFLTTGETYTSLDGLTGLSKGFISQAVPEVCKAILSNLKEFLKFPKSSEAIVQIAGEFSEKHQFPACMGALGAKEIIGLRRNSVVLLALADANSSFLYVHVDSRGANSFGGYYLRSGLHQTLKARKHFPPAKRVGQGQRLPFVIVASEAFPLQPHLMKPYPVDAAAEFESERVYNERLQRAVQVVANAFEALTQKFRVLDSGMVLRVENVEVITLACCILHNFLIKCGVPIEITRQPVTAEASTLQSPFENDSNEHCEDIRRAFVAYLNRANVE